MQYKIYQICESIRYTKFSDLKESKVDLSEYDLVYSGTVESILIDPEEVLDYLFRKFNIDHPRDFTGHSLSVSDVVKIDDEFYYCQSVGWQKVEVENG